MIKLKKPGFYEGLDRMADHLVSGLAEAAHQTSIPVQADRVGSLFGLFFTGQSVENIDDAKSCDLDRFVKYYNLMLEEGVYIAPSQFESGFVSAAHQTAHIETTIKAARAAMAKLS